MSTNTLVKTPYDEIIYKIIGCAMATHRALGPGYRENTYQRDPELRFKECGLACIPQKKLEVYDTEHGSGLIGYYI